MASTITLSAGVRQNLLSLQNTADLMAITQNRLATGKKVNSALDNPSSYFTSQSLSDRATDLNSLLDAIMQGQKTLEASDQGITSLTKLVQSAKATATQARQAPRPVTTYAAVSQNSDIASATNLNGTETIATVTSAIGPTPASMAPAAIAVSSTTLSETLGQITGGTTGAFPGGGGAVGAGNGGNLVVTVNGTDYTIAVADGDTITDVQTSINAAIGSTASPDMVDATVIGGTQIRLTAHTADMDFLINVGSSTVNLTAIGFTGGAGMTGSGTSTSLLDQIVAGGGTSGTSQLVIDVNGGAYAKTITFGTGAGQISTLGELNTELTVNGIPGGASGSVTLGGASPTITGALNLANLSGTDNSLGLTATDVGVRDALGFNVARGVGQTGGFGVAGTDLSRTYNSAATLADLNPTTLLAGGNITITINGSAQTVGLSGTDSLDDIIAKLRSNATIDANLSFTNSAGELQVTAKNADVDFSIASGAVATALGAGFAGNYNSTSLYDRLVAKLGGVSAVQDATLTFAVNGGAAQTLTFGTGQGQISTFAEFSSALSTLSGMTANLSGTTLNLQVPSNTVQTSMTVGGSGNAAIAAALGLSTSTQTGAASPTQDNAARTNLQADYNNILLQIDNLVKDASYNGINLLYGDDLKLVFNENGSSSLTISGVTFDAAGLGLTAVNGSNGSGFQDNTIVDNTLGLLDAALSNLRTQASKFGTNLTTVQTRQDFTKHLINTLQTGADNLVLADTNEEGANMLALQTRQQLSTTALSLANQASQAVLRLFG